jgi:hypothetical protein
MEVIDQPHAPGALLSGENFGMDTRAGLCALQGRNISRPYWASNHYSLYVQSPHHRVTRLLAVYVVPYNSLSSTLQSSKGVAKIGRVVWPPGVAESKGRQNEYLSKKDFLRSTSFKLLRQIKNEI